MTWKKPSPLIAMCPISMEYSPATFLLPRILPKSSRRPAHHSNAGWHERCLSHRMLTEGMTCPARAFR